MTELEIVVRAVESVVELIKSFVTGGSVDAGARLKHVLPEDLLTELAARRQDVLDEQKFGKRVDRDAR